MKKKRKQINFFIKRKRFLRTPQGKKYAAKLLEDAELKIQEFLLEEIELDKVRDVERQKIWDEAAKHGALPRGDSLSWSPNYPLTSESDLECFRKMKEDEKLGEGFTERELEKVKRLAEHYENGVIDIRDLQGWEDDPFVSNLIAEIIVSLRDPEACKKNLLFDNLHYPEDEIDINGCRKLNSTNIKTLEEFYQLLKEYYSSDEDNFL
jgi:hypothetical protein